MCGIIGILSNKNVSDRLLESLKLLEYRGYDSAGIAVLQQDGSIAMKKEVGCIDHLKHSVQKSPIPGNSGIGHTRWATHGKPEARNAHPFYLDSIALVHNGIIENHNELRAKIEGAEFLSDTDSEVVLHMIAKYIREGLTEYQAVNKIFREIEGNFAIVVMFAKTNMLIAIRRGAPLALGVGEGEMFVGSDALALAPLTDKIIYIQDDEIAEISLDTFKITNLNGKIVNHSIQKIKLDMSSADKGEYEHYMLKEIYEQPFILAKLFLKYYNHEESKFMFDNISFANYNKIYIVACGTSFHAANIAKYWIEKFAKIPVEIDLASELRYRSPVLDTSALGIFLSQSGETADTVAAMKLIKSYGIHTLAIINVQDSTIAREADFVLYLDCGYEIGVASTKVFTAQLLLLAMLSLDAGYAKNVVDKNSFLSYINNLHNLTDTVQQAIETEEQIKLIADTVKETHSMLYIGRGTSYPLSLEGALKIKEVSYIHAEGMAAGELKHGSIALIDEKLPIVAIAPFDCVFNKLVSNIQEILARKGFIISITDERGLRELSAISRFIIQVPISDDFTSPIINAIPLQLLAYHAAVLLNRNVDQPRNLAKSVTVE